VQNPCEHLLLLLQHFNVRCTSPTSWFKSHISLWVLSASHHSVIWLIGVWSFSHGCFPSQKLFFHRCWCRQMPGKRIKAIAAGTWKLLHVRFSNQSVKFPVSVLQSILSQTNPDWRFSCNNPFISSHQLLTIHVPVPNVTQECDAFLGVFAKLQNVTVSCFASYCPLHGTARLSLDGIPWNLVFEYFLKISQENSSFINIRQG